MVTSCATKYYNYHHSGYGYVRRIREVPAPKGKPYLACDLDVLNGPVDNPEHKRHDVLVKAALAKALIRKCEKAVKEGREVFIKFRAGDLTASIFNYLKGKKAGQQGISLRVNLLFVGLIEIDGQRVYEAPSNAPLSSQPSQAQPEQSNAPALDDMALEAAALAASVVDSAAASSAASEDTSSLAQMH